MTSKRHRSRPGNYPGPPSQTPVSSYTLLKAPAKRHRARDEAAFEQRQQHLRICVLLSFDPERKQLAFALCTTNHGLVATASSSSLLLNSSLVCGCHGASYLRPTRLLSSTCASTPWVEFVHGTTFTLHKPAELTYRLFVAFPGALTIWKTLHSVRMVFNKSCSRYCFFRGYACSKHDVLWRLIWTL